MADENRIITFQYAKDNYDAYKKQTIPASNECMTKADVNTYLNADMSMLSSYTNNQLVPRSRFTPLVGFDIGTGFNDFIQYVSPQPNGKILVGGGFTTFNGSSQNRLIRLNSDGPKDTSFDIGTGFNDIVHPVSPQPDGKILVGGYFTTFNDVPQKYLIRLNSDGTKDTSLNIGTGFNNYVNSISLQQDGKILVGGQFTTFNGVPQNYLIRLNPDGTKDTSFDIGTGFSYWVSRITLQPDGKIIVSGHFSSFNDAQQNRLIRLNSNGTKDTSLNIGTGFNSSVNSISLQQDGKILVGGQFTTFNGTPQNRLIRLNSDGTKDTSFDIGTGFNNYVNSISPQPDGKIIVGGFFTTFNDVPQKYLIRLNSDGTKDTSFDIGTGFGYYVYFTSTQPDGKILVGGQFTTFNDAQQNRLIRLNSDGTRDSL